MPTPPDHAPYVRVHTMLSEALELGHCVADLLPLVDLRDAAWHRWITSRHLVDRP